MIIAVDGPAASGKGTLSRRLAERLGLAYLDTGSLYRATAARVLRAGDDPHDPGAAAGAAASLTERDLDAPELREEAVSNAASVVAAIPEVRSALLEYQRAYAESPPPGKGGAVLDGRDIGTVVLPGADRKIFVTASLEERARRRHRELQARGVPSIEERVLQEMQERDARDRERSVAPLAVAADAFLLDTTELDADAAFEAALAFVLSSTARSPERSTKKR
ncbi:MAG: cytidylate kinase [Rhodospirillaceae bacterium]|nr:cytidylate kinase [Rhodospirillaceae bacterium]